VREGGTAVDVIWIDEISMLDIELLCDLSHVSFRQPPVQWILSGDFNQYIPFFNSFRGKSVEESFENSTLLHLLASGTRVTLTECKRSDEHLFDFYSSLIPGGYRYGKTLAENVQEARELFHCTKATGFIPGTALAPTNLVLSHKKRIELNARCNAADAIGRENVESFLMKDYYTEQELENVDERGPQDALFWPGLLVISRHTTKKVKNALPYEILAFEGDTVRLKLVMQTGKRLVPDEEEEEPEAEVQMSRKAFFQTFRLNYALTYASIQGVTIKTLLALHDTSHVHFNPRHLFVGTSRAIASDMLIVY
jgi:hypothetical protein